MRELLLEKSILATLIYYDCLNWPLTAFEIWQSLIRPIKERKAQRAKGKATTKSVKFSLYDVISRLEKSAYLKKYIAQKNGFYFLKGKEELVWHRIQAMKISEEKLKLLWRYRWVFLGIAFIKGVFVSGSVAGGWARKDSDIDVLVVVKKGRLWTARLFLTLWTSLLRIRRKGEKITDTVCLNHYVSTDALNIPFHSLYNAQSYIHLIPLVSLDNVFERFFQENSWIEKYFLQKPIGGNAGEFIYEFPTRRLLERLITFDRMLDEFLLSGRAGDLVETLAKKLQLFFIRRNPLTGKEGGRITAQDWQLEFHPLSKEKQMLDCYNKETKALGLKEFYPEEDSGLS